MTLETFFAYIGHVILDTVVKMWYNSQLKISLLTVTSTVTCKAEIPMRTGAIHLTEDQMEKIGVYVIKERGLELSDKGQFIFNEKGAVEFRVQPSKLCREVSNMMDMDINSYQVNKAVNWYARNAKRFKTQIIINASVQENMLKEEIAKLKGEISKHNGAMMHHESLKLKFAEIKKLAS